MCGIVGYVGRQDAPEAFLMASERPASRGYDPIGVAVQGRKGSQMRKVVGGLRHLAAPAVVTVLTVIPHQMLADRAALLPGCDVDRPCHPPTSATVE